MSSAESLLDFTYNRCKRWGWRRGEERGKEAGPSQGDEILTTHLFLHLQQAEEVQVLLRFCDLAPKLGPGGQTARVQLEIEPLSPPAAQASFHGWGSSPGPYPQQTMNQSSSPRSCPPLPPAAAGGPEAQGVTLSEMPGPRLGSSSSCSFQGVPRVTGRAQEPYC